MLRPTRPSERSTYGEPIPVEQPTTLRVAAIANQATEAMKYTLYSTFLVAALAAAYRLMFQLLEFRKQLAVHMFDTRSLRFLA